MAEEPSTKRHHGETSDKKTLTGVELHGKETLEIVYTSELEKANEMMSRLRMKGDGLYPSFIGVDVEYTSEDEPPQMAAVLQLCVEELFLVYRIAAATRWPKRLKQFLQEEKLYTFAGFSIEGDKRMLNKSGLEINRNNFINMQRKWKVPTTTKFYDSLPDVAASVIHPFYKGMKKNIDKEEDHKLWGISPLPDKLIEYAGIDAYAMYKSWKIINNIVTGWDISKEREADPYYHCNFTG
ncbi:hypothetical protein CFC21_070528 [Triticum aestivum]|uniref:3'-5' exonuclease domain-containing protein n=2 Tax=Triticum aestivum TaxID=4565 RepID=A0A9R1HES7_WHEAT|nr:hypothetical protein CFC21_070528 [Triticum aestivum]